MRDEEKMKDFLAHEEHRCEEEPFGRASGPSEQERPDRRPENRRFGHFRPGGPPIRGHFGYGGPGMPPPGRCFGQGGPGMPAVGILPEDEVPFRLIEDATPEEKLAGLLHGCGHMVRHFHGGGKSGQQRILTILDYCGVIPQRTLIDILRVQPGSLSEILGKLEEKGWIERSRNEADKRSAVVTITAEGKAALKQMQQDFQDPFTVLSDEEKDQLTSLLEKLLESWQAQRPEGMRPMPPEGGRARFPHGPHGATPPPEGWWGEPPTPEDDI